MLRHCNWSGFVWHGFIEFHFVSFLLVLIDLVSLGLVWFGLALFRCIWFGLVLFGFISQTTASPEKAGLNFITGQKSHKRKLNLPQLMAKISDFRPDHPKGDQNPQFSPLSETTRNPNISMWGSA